MSAASWTAEAPDQSGRVAVVTGATSGLGLITARELARAGARVVLTGRKVSRLGRAADLIRSAVPGAQLDVHTLDLGDLSSVREFAQSSAARVDLLVNDAGIMAPPRQVTVDGFESQLAVNHLGHFALTGLLLPRLLASPVPRVVTVTSTFHAIGRIDFADLQSERRYRRWACYAQSKLANVLFAFELDRKARDNDTPLQSVAAHPGYAATGLQTASISKRAARLAMTLSNKLFAQSAEVGALSILCAATSADLRGGALVGPKRLLGHRGYPELVRAAKRAYDTDVACRLWSVSEQLTDVRFAFSPHPRLGDVEDRATFR